MSRQLILDFPSRPEFKFSNFVKSEGSRFALQAARQISSSTDLPYNTLYLYGGRNLGKTHLLMAIGNSVSENFPDKKIIFINGQDFVRKFAEENTQEITKNLSRLLESDYFLLDDVDLISGKPSAQEKLYHVYNTLHEKNKKSIFTGRNRPEQFSDMEPYLKSRFQWGMTAEIKRIDDETTANIGRLEGGLKRNIIPEHAFLDGEFRSRSNEKLADVERKFRGVFDEVASRYPEAKIDLDIVNSYQAYNIDAKSEAVAMIGRALSGMGLEPVLETTGGGSDANVFIEKGITAIPVGIGVRDFHTTWETAVISEVLLGARMCEAVIKGI